MKKQKEKNALKKNNLKQWRDGKFPVVSFQITTLIFSTVKKKS